MLPALNDISGQQSKPTENVKLKCQELLNYAVTYPNVAVCFYASDIILHIHSYAAYPVIPKSRSCIAGYLYLDNSNKKLSILSGSILIKCKTLKSVLASAAGAEIFGVFHNA